MKQSIDTEFMAECLQLAEKGRGHVSPNPLVGALLVKNNRVVARGWHRRFGGPHAEVDCLRSYKGDARGATLYVNLEPCSHFGKTPPCTDLLIASGVQKVVVGMKDPNPLVSGRGIRKLRSAGVTVASGILHADAERLNREFVTFISKRRPFVHVKIAQSLDGKIALSNGSPTRITGIDSQRMVHKWRGEYDAILVGVGTIHADDPLLTVRLAKGRNPSVVILDGRFTINPDAKVLRTAKTRRVIVVVNDRETRRQAAKMKLIVSRGAIIAPMSGTAGRLQLREVMRRLYDFNIGSILVEGGSDIFGQFVNCGPIDLLSIFISPLLLGDGIPTMAGIGMRSPCNIPCKPDSSRLVGSDALVQFSFHQEDH